MDNYWHYKRSDFTDKIFNGIKFGLSNSFTLFSTRRMGKSEFLIEDLKPKLESENYKVIYFSFFKHSTEKVSDFILSINNENLISSIRVKEVKLPILTLGIDTEKPKITLESAFQQLLTNYDKVVLLLDEIQEVVKLDNGESFLEGLRTILDTNKNKISVVFTGSSQFGLRKMFNNKKAPFFHFGMNLELPRLNKEFTDFLCEKYHKMSKKTINNEQLYKIFQELSYTPFFIREVVNFKILEPSITLDEAFEFYKNKIFNHREIEYQFNKLSKIEQTILLYIYKTPEDNGLYTQQFQNFYYEKLKEKINNSKIQYGLNKLLESSDLRIKENNNYEISNFLYAFYLKMIQ